MSKYRILAITPDGFHTYKDIDAKWTKEAKAKYQWDFPENEIIEVRNFINDNTYRPLLDTKVRNEMNPVDYLVGILNEDGNWEMSASKMTLDQAISTRDFLFGMTRQKFDESNVQIFMEVYA